MRALCFGLLALSGCTHAAVAGALPLEELFLEVRPEFPREFLYTDKGGAHFFGEAANPASRSYHGFYSHMHEFVDGWDLHFDGQPLRPRVARVYPDRLERDLGPLVETITLLDDAGTGAALLVEWRPGQDGELQVTPRLDMRFLWEEVAPEYDLRWMEPFLLAASTRHLSRNAQEDWPVWAGFGCSAGWRWQAAPRRLARSYPKGEARRAMPRATLFLPGAFSIRCGAEQTIAFVVALGDTPEATRARLADVLQAGQAQRTARRARLQALVDTPGLEASDAELERAAAWCRLGLDQLIMRQRGLGIYAGYPWFTTYWGRDSFIALPGACLVTGDFAGARTILSTFAAHQISDANDRHAGRLPNFVTVDQVQYATADGTWWWFRALRQYEDTSGDVAFADSLYPVVQRALNGALAQQVDAYGLLRHGDGETWMDAGGEANPLSPRGDRAIEVQALFASALDYGIELARRARERGDALRWSEARARLGIAFEQRFFDATTHLPFDHLNPDGSADHQVRPNALLAWFAAPQLFDAVHARSTLEQVRDVLTYPWGVGSLAPEDPQFHPKHLALERYHYDAAYHNGDVWLWLSGPLVSALVAQQQADTAWQQTLYLRDELLQHGVAGSLREIRDAVDTGKDEFGGACAQAWSLSEFQRNLYEDYLGAHVEAPRGRVVIEPRLPSSLTHLGATVTAGSARLRVRHERHGDSAQVTQIVPQEQAAGWLVRVVHTTDDGTRRGIDLPLGKRAITVRSNAADFFVDGEQRSTEVLVLEPAPARPRTAARFRQP